MANITIDGEKLEYDLDYSNVFGAFNDTTLALINSCQYVKVDNGGEYVYDAVLCSEDGIVTFQKRYLDGDPNYAANKIYAENKKCKNEYPVS